MTLADPVELFARRVKASPDHVAIAEAGRSTSYGELSELAARFAAAFRAKGGCVPRVLIHLPQCAEAYAAMLGSLMAGGIYAPNNLSAPVPRQRAVHDAFEPDVVVAVDGALEALGVGSADARRVNPAALPAPLPASAWSADDLAYVMFTSGSTGAPKGVMVARQGLAHYTDWAIAAMDVRPEDRWSQHPNLGFDLSVLDIYGALCGGATLVPLSRQGDRLTPAAAVRRHKLTIWNSVPSVVDLMMRARQVTTENLRSLRLLTFCGEPLLPAHLDAIFAARPDVVVHNTYGPTEATVSCTLVRLTAPDYRDACRASVALGEPIPGMDIWLEGGDSADDGEVVIGGPQVARGYWRDRERTTAVFGQARRGAATVPSYRTGDRAVRSGRHLFFVERVDRQVKILGHRIELGEIDAALRACGASAACTVLWNGELHAFIEGTRSAELSDLRAALAVRLPTYAIPTHLHAVAALPRNVNDKADAGALIAHLVAAGVGAQPEYQAR